MVAVSTAGIHLSFPFIRFISRKYIFATSTPNHPIQSNPLLRNFRRDSSHIFFVFKPYLTSLLFQCRPHCYISVHFIHHSPTASLLTCNYVYCIHVCFHHTHSYSLTHPPPSLLSMIILTYIAFIFFLSFFVSILIH